MFMGLLGRGAARQIGCICVSLVEMELSANKFNPIIKSEQTGRTLIQIKGALEGRCELLLPPFASTQAILAPC